MAAVFLIGMKNAWFGNGLEYMEAAKTHGLNLFILGLLFIALAKDKTEDELTLLLKTKAFAGGFDESPPTASGGIAPRDRALRDR